MAVLRRRLVPEICMQCTALDGQGLLSSLHNLHHQGLEDLTGTVPCGVNGVSHGTNSAEIPGRSVGVSLFWNHQKMALNSDINSI